jgi:acetyl-CoA decarbonylase/synthase complex subunit delta
MIVTVGEESWRQKESKVPEGVPAAWGDFRTRGVVWEITTAGTLLQSGADVVVLRHPKSIALARNTIAGLMTK